MRTTFSCVELFVSARVDNARGDTRLGGGVASHFIFNKVPLRLNLVKRRGTDPTIHIAGFKDVPVCLTSKGRATAQEGPIFERVEGRMDCVECEQWAKTFEDSWIKAGDVEQRRKRSR